ncbi:hypothetical protein [Ferrovibrio terrae]|uniref:hypothetical protein n=1 Tax=Ferrovibrio terrae TaxID=2594003 RepID=UPI003137CE51
MPTTIMTLGISEPDLAAYADGLYGAYGETAPSYARRRASDFKTCGDHGGEAVWTRLAAILESKTKTRTASPQ